MNKALGSKETAKSSQEVVEMKTKKNQRSAFAKSFIKGWPLYLLLIVPILHTIIFEYIPMGGLVLAFKEYDPVDGFKSGRWLGFSNFIVFFKSYNFVRIVRNTILINLYELIAGFPIPIILAISINEVRSKSFKKSVQLITYAPHFISTVILVSIVMQVLSIHTGIVNNVIKALGHTPINFMGDAKYFRHIFVWSGIWKNMGYSSIIYIAALTAIDPELYEAAKIDGASKLKRIFYIDIPGILPTAIVLLILQFGKMMKLGFEKVYLLQNDVNISASEVISTYSYKIGLVRGDFSFATAIGFFNSVINLVLIVVVNRIARKVGETSLW